MTSAPVTGTRYSFPQESVTRLRVIDRLRRLYNVWGYEPIEVPALEGYDPDHPAAANAFKLSDIGGGVLALRADFTPAIARLVQLHFPEAAGHQGGTKRFQYCGQVWHAIDPDIARTREFTQIGLELVGASSERADAELVHLARESVREVGLAPRVEIGYPGFVQALFDLGGVPDAARDDLADAIDRKDVTGLRTLLEPLSMAADVRRALLATPDLFGTVAVLDDAFNLAPWPETRTRLKRLASVLAQFEDDRELLLDFGMARRHRYYTGITFRAYTFDFGQPLLGGGRYDGALLPFAAGFAIGLERLQRALPLESTTAKPLLLSLDDARARQLRDLGLVVERSLDDDEESSRRYASLKGIPYLVDANGNLQVLTADAPDYGLVSSVFTSDTEQPQKHE